MSTYLIQVEKIQNFWRRNRKEKNRLGRKLDRLIGTEKKISSKQHLRRDIDRQIGRHIDRHTDRPIYIQIDRYIDWQKDRCTDRLIQREIERYIDKLIDGYIERGDEMCVCVCLVLASVMQICIHQAAQALPKIATKLMRKPNNKKLTFQPSIADVNGKNAIASRYLPTYLSVYSFILFGGQPQPMRWQHRPL